MIDVITHCPDLDALRVELLALDHPLVSVSEEGEAHINLPMTPVRYSINESIALCRVGSLDELAPITGLVVLASAPAGGTAAFEALFTDAAATATYNRVYDQTPITGTDEEGNSYSHTPPRIFGVFA